MQKNTQIKLYENKNKIVNAASDKIVVEIFNKKNEASSQLIVMSGISTLAGTTSTAIDLSIAMAATNRKTLLIDCDVRKAAKYKKLNEQVRIGLADYLLQEIQQESDEYDTYAIEQDDIICPTNVENLDYIPCGNSYKNPTRVLCAPKLSVLLETLKKKYDYIICDLPSISVVPDAQILFPMADGIIMISALGETRKYQVKEAKRKIEPYHHKYYGMIVNKIDKKIYKRMVKNYDYYIQNASGEQKLGGAAIKKGYKNTRKAGKKK